MKYPQDYQWPNLKEFISLESHLGPIELTPIDEVDPYHPDFPASWRPLIGATKTASAALLWGRVAPFLPRFVQRVSQDLLGLFWAKTEHLGHFLVYLMDDWGDYHGMPSVFFAGPPATEAQIDAWEAENGILPAAIRQLWLSHAYIELKESGTIYSCGLQGPAPSVHLQVLGPRQLVDDPTQELECLAVGYCNKDYAWAVTRPISAKEWSDQVVIAEFRGSTFEHFIYDTLDEFFLGELESDLRDFRPRIPED